ncbi:unnamed protein product [Pleuronectes platessa]|uniref:Uncharacterized protein n=1 Tax=Pleuronectes platessa TaxID=8262 RepID=A0A9N7Z346_PLEPL|nr:unnamed protein product [Pleuronectes platessa]
MKLSESSSCAFHFLLSPGSTSSFSHPAIPAPFSWLAVTRIGPPAKKKRLPQESGKSRQRHKDVNAVPLSASEQACDPTPNAFDYINYCEPDGASGSDLTAIHNRGCHGPTNQDQVALSTAPRSPEKTFKYRHKLANAHLKLT